MNNIGMDRMMKRVSHPPHTPARGLIWLRACLAAAILFGLAGELLGPPAVAQECSIAALGENVYVRAKRKVSDNFGTKDGFSIDPYGKAIITIKSDCVFNIVGKFHFLSKHQLKQKIYEAKMKIKDGAPNGIEILSFNIRDD